MDLIILSGLFDLSEGVKEFIESMDVGNKVVGLDRDEQSWVSVAEDKKKLKKYDVEVSMKVEKYLVEILDEILESFIYLWEDFVVGKFLD